MKKPPVTFWIIDVVHEMRKARERDEEPRTSPTRILLAPQEIARIGNHAPVIVVSPHEKARKFAAALIVHLPKHLLIESHQMECSVECARTQPRMILESLGKHIADRYRVAIFLLENPPS
ncbi:MAG: hypothetical protein AAB511_03965 [Patescibacteria group bacterium]